MDIALKLKIFEGILIVLIVGCISSFIVVLVLKKNELTIIPIAGFILFCMLAIYIRNLIKKKKRESKNQSDETDRLLGKENKNLHDRYFDWINHGNNAPFVTDPKNYIKEKIDYFASLIMQRKPIDKETKQEIDPDEKPGPSKPIDPKSHKKHVNKTASVNETKKKRKKFVR